MVDRLPSIAHLTSVHQIDDIRIFVKECRALAATGFDVALIGPASADREADGVKIMGVPLPKSRLYRMTVTSWHVLKRALQSKAHICHFHDPELIPVGILLKLTGRQVVYDVHEDYPRDILTKNWLHPGLRYLVAKITDAAEWSVARLIDGTVAVTPNIASRFPRSKTITLRNFPSLDELQTAAPVPYQERPFKICYVGGLAANRGLFDMIDGIGGLEIDAPCIDEPCLALAGRSPVLKRRLKARLDQGGKGRTSLAGLTESTLPDFLAMFEPGWWSCTLPGPSPEIVRPSGKAVDLA